MLIDDTSSGGGSNLIQLPPGEQTNYTTTGPIASDVSIPSPAPVVDYYTPRVPNPTDGGSATPTIVSANPDTISLGNWRNVIDTSVSTPAPIVPTIEGSVPGSSPTPVASLDQSQTPVGELTSLMDLFNNRFHPPGQINNGPVQQGSGFVVLPTPSGEIASSSSSGNSGLLLWLAVLGIAATIGAHWWFNRRKKT